MESHYGEKDKVMKWLTRLGILDGDVTFKQLPAVIKKTKTWKITRHVPASVEYIFKGKTFKLACDVYPTFTENLNAVQILIHSRVLGIERGIESVEQSFAGYTALPAPENVSDFFIGCQDLEELDLRKKKLALKMHPDRPGGSPERFQKMMDQYEMVKRSWGE